MKPVTRITIAILALATLLAQVPLAVYAEAPLWQHAMTLVMKGGTTVTIDGVDYVACTIHNEQGVPIGTYLTPVAALDLESPIRFTINGGTLEGTFGSILTDGIFPDGTYEILDDSQNGKKYFVFSGTTEVGGSGDWVGTGSLAGVQSIIWRCKFELEVDGDGNLVIDPATSGPKLVACFYCVYTLVYDDVPA